MRQVKNVKMRAGFEIETMQNGKVMLYLPQSSENKF